MMGNRARMANGALARLGFKDVYNLRGGYAAGRMPDFPWRSDLPTVTMYTTAVCPYCIQAERFLKARGVTEIARIRVDIDPTLRRR